MNNGKKLNNTFETNAYLDLLKKCLTRFVFEDKYDELRTHRLPVIFIQKMLDLVGLHLLKKTTFDPQLRREGKDWPTSAETMVGLYRLDNIQSCMVDILKRNVPGDFIEAGVWRGGATILMRAILKQFNITDRTVWVADSFQGLPKPNPDKYELDKDDTHWKFDPLSVSLEEVRANFAKYGLLDDQVKFLTGWFKDTLPKAPLKKLALLRVDGDMYGSTMEALVYLYPKLSAGGYVIIDDYEALPNCKAAVKDFRDKAGIKDKIYKIDWTGIFWQRTH